MKPLYLLLFIVLLSGCITNKDISQNASRYTDFVVGRVYRLKREVTFAANVNGLLSAGRVKSNTHLQPGAELLVTKIYYSYSPAFGKATSVHATINDKRFVDREVDITWISNSNLQTGKTWIDPEFLELFEH